VDPTGISTRYFASKKLHQKTTIPPEDIMRLVRDGREAVTDDETPTAYTMLA